MVGDHVWWLALLNAFVPFFFVPLLALLFIPVVYRRRSFLFAFLPPLLIFLVLYGYFFLPSRSVVRSTEPSITIMSFNIWGGSQERETAQVILKYGTPNIVVLQELAPSMAVLLRTDFAVAYPYQLLQPVDGYKGMGILSRYPLTPLDHLTSPRQSGQSRTCRLPSEISSSPCIIVIQKHRTFCSILEQVHLLPRQYRAAFAWEKP